MHDGYYKRASIWTLYIGLSLYIVLVYNFRYKANYKGVVLGRRAKPWQLLRWAKFTHIIQGPQGREGMTSEKGKM